jgi:hypothetical protein
MFGVIFFLNGEISPHPVTLKREGGGGVAPRGRDPQRGRVVACTRVCLSVCEDNPTASFVSTNVIIILMPVKSAAMDALILKWMEQR